MSIPMGYHHFHDREHAHEWLEANGASWDADMSGDPPQYHGYISLGDGLAFEEGELGKSCYYVFVFPEAANVTYDHRGEG